MPIPLVVSPTSAMPVWEVDQQATPGASREGDVVAPRARQRRLPLAAAAMPNQLFSDEATCRHGLLPIDAGACSLSRPPRTRRPAAR
jgi:hypothetical protein